MTDREQSAVPQLLGAAVGIVLGSALLFALLGTLRDDTPTPEVAADDQTEQVTADPTETVASPQPDDDGGDVPGDEPTATPDDATVEPEPSPEPEPEPEPEPVATIDPSTISIQVLDAVTGGDGTAAAAVADELRAAGYNVVVVNRAGRSYDVTTVFWSAGRADAGRQVAGELGAGRAEETPEEVRLSDSVAVHVVVGTDRS